MCVDHKKVRSQISPWAEFFPRQVSTVVTPVNVVLRAVISTPIVTVQKQPVTAWARLETVRSWQKSTITAQLHNYRLLIQEATPTPRLLSAIYRIVTVLTSKRFFLFFFTIVLPMHDPSNSCVNEVRCRLVCAHREERLKRDSLQCTRWMQDIVGRVWASSMRLNHWRGNDVSDVPEC